MALVAHEVIRQKRVEQTDEERRAKRDVELSQDIQWRDRDQREREQVKQVQHDYGIAAEQRQKLEDDGGGVVYGREIIHF